MPSLPVIAVGVLVVVGLAFIAVLVLNTARPEAAVSVDWPTPALTPRPTKTPKPTTLPLDTAALRMLWLPSPACGISNDAATHQWFDELLDNPGQCRIADSWNAGETGALGSGVVHFPNCARNDDGIGRYALLVPARYPAPTALTVDGVNQQNAFVRQQGRHLPYRHEESDVEYRVYVSGYRLLCHIWDGDRITVTPHPLPTPTHTPEPTATPTPTPDPASQPPPDQGA